MTSDGASNGHSTSDISSLLVAPTLQPRLRHISAIHVRNLTPFPARDALASALAQPSEQPQFTTHGQLSDDWDVTLSKKRTRRISSTSVASVHSLWLDHSPIGGESPNRNAFSRAIDQRGRERKISQGKSTSGSAPDSSGDIPSTPLRRTSSASVSTPTIRQRRHQRNLSTASGTVGAADTSMAIQASSSLSGVPYGTLSAMLPDHSQKGLEKVIMSRLVETFLSITALGSHTQDVDADASASTASDLSSSTPLSLGDATSAKAKSKVAHTMPSARESPRSRFSKDSGPSNDASTLVRTSPMKSTIKHSKSPTVTPHRRNNVTSPTPGKSSSSPKIPSPMSSPQRSSASTSRPSVPDYLTPIHRPSTNPSFSIDAGSAVGFPEWTDLSATRLRVELWGKVCSDWSRITTASGKGKEKEKYPGVQELTAAEWKVLHSWDIDLKELIPLPDDQTTQLPSNSLLVTLTPPGQVFYLPTSHLTPRPLTPSVGYNSDSELDARIPTQAPGDSAKDSILHSAQIVSRSRRRHRRTTGSASDTGEYRVKSPGWQDLFKLVTLQSCILDTQKSLTEVVRNIDKALESDVTSALKREAAERESYVEGLRSDRDSVNAKSAQLRNQIAARRKELQVRREQLAQAREHLVEDQGVTGEVDLLVREEELRLQILRARFPVRRTALLSTLASIFPIELLSPPDLLYSIVAVPLPIPLAHGDPAPPLTLAHIPDVTEDGVATALGYVAQVVQLLAAYLGKGLVYPVTCIGSRSLVRDGISSMVGPRMFPLFSRGVDTYRFEYGVFLLNKNIEMLMSDRDLRALDMRHTLPNLKNLLLILTDGELPEPPRIRPHSNLSAPTAGLIGPTEDREASPSPALTPKARTTTLAVEDDSEPTRATSTSNPPHTSAEDISPVPSKTTDGVSLPRTHADDDEEAGDIIGSSPSQGASRSGATTPTPPTPVDALKRAARPFLSLSPLSSFLRSRYAGASAGTGSSTGSSPSSGSFSVATPGPESKPGVEGKPAPGAAEPESVDGNGITSRGSETPDDSEEEGEGEGDEDADGDADRRTIRGMSINFSAGQEEAGGDVDDKRSFGSAMKEGVGLGLSLDEADVELAKARAQDDREGRRTRLAPRPPPGVPVL